MVNAGGPDRITRIAGRIASCSAVFVFAILGMLITPVSCTCGAQIPHGHSLFQLPHHYHGGDPEAHPGASRHAEHGADSRADINASHSTRSWHNVMAAPGACEKTGKTAGHSMKFSFALDNLLEQGEGSSVSPPPTSSFGQPIAIAQPSLVSLPASGSMNCLCGVIETNILSVRVMKPFL
jgi:hypothetical protein